MWNTLATFRENLSQIASEVLDTAEELEIGGLQEATSASHDDDESPHTRFKRYSTLMHNKANGQSEEATESVEKILRHHTSGLPLLPKSYSSDLQLKWNHGSSDVDGKLTENRSGISSDSGTRPEDLEYKVATLQEREKDLFSQVSAKEQAYRILKEEQDTFLAELERVKQALSSERLDLSEKNLQLQRQNEALEEAVKECNVLKDEKDRMCVELAELHRREDEEVASRDCTIDQMQADFQCRADEQVAAKDAKLAELQRAVTELQEEKCALQAEREKLREDLQSLQQGTPVERVLENEQCEVNSAELERLDLRSQVKQVDTLSNRLKMAEEELALEKLQHQKRLDAVSMERDKAIRDLSRLKQHLLEKELADSEKMDHDSEQIQELESRAATSSARVLQLEQSLSLALANQAESNKRSADELRRAREEVESLNQKLSNVLLALDSKDVELANLQSALGQYYAESEAQERLHGELRSSKEEIARLLDNLRAANRLNEDMRQEKKDVLEKLALAEQKLLVNQQGTQKLEEDVSRLRHALEQSLTRLNRMSSDSDYYVDRRIVIKLLVTYFQRKHSHEVLDLMARMLGFSEEDKQRVGLAHDNAGKTGVVRSVLGIPGRFVGGLLGSGVPNTSFVAAENQSFADLWIDFLLKESEERDRRERAELDTKPVSETSGLGHDSMSVQANSNYHDENFSGRKNIPQLNFHSSVNQKPSDHFPTAPPSPQDGYQNHIATTGPSWQGAENGVVSKNERGDIMGAEFSTVPLTSSSLPSRANFGHGKFASRS